MADNICADFLTGFSLRDSLYPAIERLILESQAQKKGFSLALFDLDRFKKFNDKYGHDFGDEMLRYASSTLRLTVSETESLLFRYGGDEFIVLFPGRDHKEAARLMRQCGYNLSHRPFLFKNKFYRMSFSCGIASFPSDDKAIDGLISKADKAMYFSKRHGRGKVTQFARIAYLNFRNALITVLSCCVIVLSGFLAYHLTFRSVISPVLGRVQHARIIIKPSRLDTVVLKNGDVYEGSILEETPERVVLSLYLDKGEGTVTFQQEEISSIQYKKRE